MTVKEAVVARFLEIMSERNIKPNELLLPRLQYLGAVKAARTRQCVHNVQYLHSPLWRRA